jgi:hypothetical protein
MGSQNISSLAVDARIECGDEFRAKKIKKICSLRDVCCHPLRGIESRLSALEVREFPYPPFLPSLAVRLPSRLLLVIKTPTLMLVMKLAPKRDSDSSARFNRALSPIGTLRKRSDAGG